jgi:transketolase N-terminal domain/subunit
MSNPYDVSIMMKSYIVVATLWKKAADDYTEMSSNDRYDYAEITTAGDAATAYYTALAELGKLITDALKEEG